MTENSFCLGGAIKSAPDGKVSGWLLRFHDGTQTDIQGEYFTKNTDFGIAFDENGEAKTKVLYHHGLDEKIGDNLYVDGQLKMFDEGVWIDTQLDLSNKYQKAVSKLFSILGWSVGTAKHMIKTVKHATGATEILRFPLGLDASLTPIPADPTTLPGLFNIGALKSLQATDIEVLSEGGNAESSIAVENLTINTKGITIVTDENDKKPEDENEVVPPVDMDAQALKSLQETVAAQQKELKSFVDIMKQSGKLKDLGYIAPDSEGNDNHNEVKSLGDFFVAVANKNIKRLDKIYNVKAQIEGVGSRGGYLVPEQFIPKIYEVMSEESGIIARVTQQPVTSPVGSYPSLDQTFALTGGTGQSSYNAGLDTNARTEGGAYTEETMNFGMIEWKVNDSLSGKIKISIELANDAPFIEALLRSRIATTQRMKTEFFILRGNGVNQPKGILNAACKIDITPATNSVFAVADAATMMSRHISVGGQPVWIAHKSVLPDLVGMESSSGGAVWQANYTSGIGGTLFGHPIIYSEHMPQANNSGNVVLADLSVFALFTLGGVYIDFSEHADFENGNGVWRWGGRIDGKVQLEAAITDASPQGSFTVSPIVSHND